MIMEALVLKIARGSLGSKKAEVAAFESILRTQWATTGRDAGEPGWTSEANGRRQNSLTREMIYICTRISILSEDEHKSRIADSSRGAPPFLQQGPVRGVHDLL